MVDKVRRTPRRDRPSTPADLAGLDQADAQLTRSVAEMEVLAAAISHDLKNPLATVTGCVHLLEHLDQADRVGPEYDRLLRTVGDAASSMRILIDDLLAYAAAPEAPLQLRPVDLDGLVNDAVSVRVNLLHHRAGPGGPPPIISVEPLPPVIADPVMLRRVVENLLDNAIKYTRPGEPAMVRVSARRQLAGQARVEMADRGIGIPEGQHDAVFTSFHRAHADAGYPGTGLGLATCQRIIARHGGTIGAQPNRGGGTRFWFTLPEAPAEDHRPVG